MSVRIPESEIPEYRVGVIVEALLQAVPLEQWVVVKFSGELPVSGVVQRDSGSLIFTGPMGMVTLVDVNGALNSNIEEVMIVTEDETEKKN